MDKNLYCRLIQYIDALYDDGRLTTEDLQRLSSYVLKIGSVRDRAKIAEKEEKSTEAQSDSALPPRRGPFKSASSDEIDDIISDILAYDMK